MFNKRMLAVLKREIKSRVLSKGFIFMTLGVPLFIFGLMGLQMFLINFEQKKETRLEIIVENPALIAPLQAEFDSSEAVMSGEFMLSFSTRDSAGFRDYYLQRKADILENEITGLVFIPATAADDKHIEYYSTNPNNNYVTFKIGGAVNTVLIDQYFSGRDVSREDLRYARKNVDFARYRVSKEKLKEEGFGNLILAFFFTMMLYFSLLFLGNAVMQSVVEEKNNRIIELLLSSVNSTELMIGKIVGTGLTGLLQMTIWNVPVMIISLNIWFVLPPEFVIDISLGKILIFLLYFVIGLVTYCGLYAMVGAIFDNNQDAQSGVWPVTMMIIIPFYIPFTMIKDPSNIIAEVCSMLPFFSILVMPPRMTLIDVPLWQHILAILVNIGTLLGVFLIVGKIYRIGILMTGKKPKWSEVAKWLKASN